ncbi:twin-arginine translocation signal domain-containing protein [Pseudomonas sp. 6D_7.1_Bac1]|uniref:twin-arginine translocation signal domain-containing protein n=1 Tax=Pseudomonas sp. 6D_7.1_Bac1 TaxID=2971615 RepID=UPI0021C7F19F|nr:twin-arginine translocation signal domain-containing protein [Pseudomonas sp. 6D_7.1_Bac1]MCU1753114.1 twin-arginine translocation signal domain-containing protein [Pseudomonas sp. 6D_7.1_Bac1]
MRPITRRQLLTATACGVAGLTLGQLALLQSKRPTPHQQDLPLLEQVDAACEQLFNSMHIVAPLSLAKH